MAGLVRRLFRIEFFPQLLFRNVAACLAQNCPQRTDIKLIMHDYCQCLGYSRDCNPSQLDMTAFLSGHSEAELR